jgi:hypothetical protein
MCANRTSKFKVLYTWDGSLCGVDEGRLKLGEKEGNEVLDAREGTMSPFDGPL